MTKTTRVIPMVLALASTVAIGACSKPKPAPAPTPTAAPTTARDTAQERRDREAAMARESASRAAEAEAARARFVADSIKNAEDAMRRDSDMLRSTVTSVIGFEFNKADLRDDAKAALDAKIPILLANAGVNVRISGHADERGSTEYNLALGTERAAMAKRYLVERGVAASRIETTSFGEERPLCTEQTDPCWAQNRRDEFEITAGGPMLVRPKS
jgi:peptidoglycan-associated lipoprotein